MTVDRLVALIVSHVHSISIRGGTTDIRECMSTDSGQCVVTTFVAADGIRRQYPDALRLSKTSHSLLFVGDGEFVYRTYLPSTPEMKAAIAQSVSAGLAVIAPSLSTILPLINLIVSYALLDGTVSAAHI